MKYALVLLMLVGCGGAPFEVGLDAPGDAGSSPGEDVVTIRLDPSRPDAPSFDATPDGLRDSSAPSPDSARLNDDGAPPGTAHETIEAAAADAGRVDDAGPLEASSDGAGDAVASFPPEAAPPALCCMTPCGGAQVAAITCGNGPAWTCDTAGGASCDAVRCSGGCHWQGVSCAGTVAPCP